MDAVRWQRARDVFLEICDAAPAERQALLHELANPQPPTQLLSQVKDPELAQQFYLCTLLAIDIDTDAERNYVLGLPAMLGLSQEQVAQIHQQLNVPLPS